MIPSSFKDSLYIAHTPTAFQASGSEATKMMVVKVVGVLLLLLVVVMVMAAEEVATPMKVVDMSVVLPVVVTVMVGTASHDRYKIAGIVQLLRYSFV